MANRQSIDVHQLAAAMTTGVESGDLSAVDSLLSASFKAWHNFSPTFKPWLEVRENLARLRPLLNGMRYENVRVTEIHHGWVQQHLLRLTLKDGSQREIHAVLIFKVDEQGRVSSLEEYLDPGQLP